MESVDSREAHEVAVVGGERRIVESPVAQVVAACVVVPLGHGHVRRDLHPVALG